MVDPTSKELSNNITVKLNAYMQPKLAHHCFPRADSSDQDVQDYIPSFELFNSTSISILVVD
jgi:hypothetical protein